MITVIGNGESRKPIKISKIPGIKIGCNAIYLHEKVDYICAMDKFWRDKISQETKIPLISRQHNTSFQTMLEIYQNGRWENTDCYYHGYCSGITALDFIANKYKKEDIYLIGFDFDYKGDLVNHVYKDTKNHPKSDRPAQSEDLFLKQCLATIKRYPKHTFIWVSNSDFLINIGLRNFKTMSLNSFDKLLEERANVEQNIRQVRTDI